MPKTTYKQFLASLPPELHTSAVQVMWAFYDVTRAMWYASALEAEEHDATGLAEFYGLLPEQVAAHDAAMAAGKLTLSMFHVVVDDEFKQRAAEVDMSYPIIMGVVENKEGASTLLLDGCHRLYRHMQEGHTKVALKLLDSKQTQRCRIR